MQPAELDYTHSGCALDKKGSLRSRLGVVHPHSHNLFLFSFGTERAAYRQALNVFPSGGFDASCPLTLQQHYITTDLSLMCSEY